MILEIVTHMLAFSVGMGVMWAVWGRVEKYW